MKNKILISLVAIMFGVIFTLTSNNVFAAQKNDLGSVSITVPDKITKWEKSQDDGNDSLFKYVEYYKDEGDNGHSSFYINSRYSDTTKYKINTYTNSDAEEMLAELKEDSSYEDEYMSHKLEEVSCKLTTLDGVPAIKTKYRTIYKDKELNTTTDLIHESYELNLDSYAINISITIPYSQKSYLDSTEYKNMISSIDIKGTYTKTISSTQTLKGDYFEITLPKTYFYNIAWINEYNEEDYTSEYASFNNKDYSNYMNYNIFYMNTDYKRNEFTSKDVEERAKGIDDRDNEDDFSISKYTILNKELVNIDGVSAIKIRYEVKYYYKESKESSYQYHEEYYIDTDNTSYSIYFDSDSTKYFDSTEYKNIIKSIQIKDTVAGTRVTPFTDVKTTSWYYEAVKYCYTNKIINGINGYTFEPSTKLTRAMLASILYKMEGQPKVTATSTFSDVKSGKWYHDAIVWAKENKIVNGYKGTTKFGPNDNVLRQDLAGMLANYAKYKGKNIEAEEDFAEFTDASSISSYAIGSMKWAVKNNVINGSKGKLNPKGTATRAEAAGMIYNYCTKIK